MKCIMAMINSDRLVDLSELIINIYNNMSNEHVVVEKKDNDRKKRIAQNESKK
jgi:hypothetical protein